MLRKLNLFCIIFACFVVFPFVSAAQNGTEPVTTTDLLKLKTMSQIDVSADGLKAVFVVTSIATDEKGEHKYFRHLWMSDLKKSFLPVQLTFGDRNDSSPVWAPDMSRIAFVRQHKSKAQIWVLPVTGGESYPVTEAEFGASQPRWSPDSKKILFVSDIPDWSVEGKPTWPHERPERTWGDEVNWKKSEKQNKKASNEDSVKAKPDGTLEEIRAWLSKNASENNPRVFTRLNIQGELALQASQSFSHLFVVQAELKTEAVQLTRGFQDFGGAEWSPDGKKIISASVKYSAHPDRTLDSDLWILNSDGSDAKIFLDWPDFRVSRPYYSPDGQKILFVASDQKNPGYAQSHLAVIDAEGGKPQWLTFDFDRRVSDHRWSPDGKHVYFVAASLGAFPLYRIPSSGGKVETIIDGPRGIGDYGIGGKKLVYSLTEVSNPYELYVSDIQGHDVRQLTRFNSEWVGMKRIVFPQEKWVFRPDGRKIQYWVMEPANRQPGKQYPLVLEIHGGPSSMWGPGEFTMWHEFQLLTSWGYGVVYCNPRGSGGYGFEFRKANYRDWGTGPASDILAVASQASELDWVNPDQQVVTGGSYAGYMTAWIVSQDHRFKAAVAQRGVYELSVFFGEGRAWRLVPNHFGGYPWEEEARKFLDANSPLTFVENIQTPLLIIHSDQDLRTGVVQSESLYKSLKVLNRPVEYVRYPKEGHDLSRSGDPKRRMDRLNRIIEFFERYVDH